MINKTYHNERGIDVLVHFDDLEYQKLEAVGHSIFYECRGFDVNGGEYSGVVEKCCGEYLGITDIEEL
jgi:hypothetical protein